jgi:hypothetical protein
MIKDRANGFRRAVLYSCEYIISVPRLSGFLMGGGTCGFHHLSNQQGVLAVLRGDESPGCVGSALPFSDGREYAWRDSMYREVHYRPFPSTVISAFTT